MNFERELSSSMKRVAAETLRTPPPPVSAIRTRVRRRQSFILLSSLLVISSLAGVALLGTRGDVQKDPTRAGGDPVPSPTSSPTVTPEDAPLACTTVSQELNFPNYWAGVTFDGLSVKRVMRWCDPPPSGGQERINRVEYAYGPCIPGRYDGCAHPVNVETWPVRDWETYGLTGLGHGSDTEVNGFPARRFRGFDERIEIYRPDVTIVISGRDSERFERFAEALTEGPSLLTDLSSYGIVFDSRCLDDGNVCSGFPSSQTSSSPPSR